MKDTGPKLGELEQLVLSALWQHGRMTSEALAVALAPSRPLKDSTIRTVLRRLEAKGYVSHTVKGRRFVYEGAKPLRKLGLEAVRSVIGRFFEGSVEPMLAGMVETKMIDRRTLRRLETLVEKAERRGGK